MISTKIKKLRQKFSKYNIDGYIVPKNDEYFNEYSSPDRLKFISDFDGSAGLAVILSKKLSICGWEIHDTSQISIWKKISILLRYTKNYHGKF